MEHASRPLHRRLRPRTSPPRAASLASALVVVAWFLAPTALARDFYVDPETGSPDNDGSAEHPWRTLEEVIAANLVETRTWQTLPYAPGASFVPVNPGAPIGPGDTIWLRSGYHGDVTIGSAYNASTITVAAEAKIAGPADSSAVAIALYLSVVWCSSSR